MKKSNNPIIAELTKSIRKRQTSLEGVKVPITFDGEAKVRWCVWCVEVKLHNRNQKYCSDLCRNSTWAWAYPQKEEGLYYLLQRQQFKCASCQFDYKPTLTELAKEYAPWRDFEREFFWGLMKRLKNRMGTIRPDRRPEVDHVIPVSKGGDGLGLDNHECKCYLCHKAKTKVDLSGKRVKKSLINI